MIQQTSLSLNRMRSDQKADPIVLCAADDAYARPLGVMLRSAGETLGPGRRLRVIVMDGGITEANWQRLRTTLADLPVDCVSIRPDRDELVDLVTSHHITHTAYFRLLAGRLLPDTIDRVIYLDSDVLVREDLGWLWEQELGNDWCLAVPDIACPYIDARRADCNFRQSSPYLAVLAPVANWQQHGLDPAAPYFNSGVMVLNIRRWREESVEVRLLDCLREHRRYVWCWDQYALNVVFGGQWRSLPARWNQGAHIYEFPDESHSPIEQTQFVEARDRPAIIHYTTEWKPWHYANGHPRRDLFFEQLDRTAWRGWRPDRPPFSLRKQWDQLALAVIKQSTITYRKLAARMGSHQ